MPRFVYRALNAAGEIVDGERESVDRGELVAALKAEGLRPLKAQRKGHGLRLKLDLGSQRRVDEAALALFTRGVATLLGAGLPLEQALAEAAEDESVPAMREAVRAVLARVRSGASLADALAEHGDAFPPYYVGLVRAGEAGGTLAEVMRDLADSVERARGLRQDIRSALVYPVLVLVTAVGSVLILLLAVIPEFEPLFEGAGDSLPMTAAAVMWLSRMLRADGWLILLLLLLAAIGLRAAWHDARLRRALDARFLHMPLVGPVLAKTETARFARSLGTLLKNGVDLVPALSMAARTLANAVLVQGIEGIVPRVRRGEGVSGPLAAAGILPPMAERLVRVGESSGALATMLLTVARIHEEEVAREIKRLVALLVPAVTLALGVLVVAIVGSILSAILASYDLPF
ncbi:MAG: type II secretion system F family protein [Alphaproteobacteria bacterium]|nr:MAG: type II secretion system F family protein [Alphaproteobacteria bacterium]